MEGKIEVYQSSDGQTQIEVKFEHDTAWLSQEQINKLFMRERSVITKHIGNVFKEGELDEESNVQNLHIAGADRPTKFYNLDVLISVGYRVKLSQGTKFRIWATRRLKDYLIQGYALNKRRLAEKQQEVPKILVRFKGSFKTKKIFIQEGKSIIFVCTGDSNFCNNTIHN